MKKPRLVLFFVFLFLIASRIYFAIKYPNDSDILVAALNFIALFIIEFDLAEQSKNRIIAKIKSSCDSNEISHREIQNFSKSFYVVLIFGNLAIIVFYYLFLCSSTANDILAIIALGLSVLDKEVVHIASSIYKV